MPHKITDERVLFTAALASRFHDEAMMEHGDPRFVGLVQAYDGKIRAKQFQGSPDLHPTQRVFGEDVLTALNRHLHFDGAWCCVFTNPQQDGPLEPMIYRRVVFLWMDADGDVHVPYEWLEDEGDTFFSMMARGPDPWLEGAEAAWMIAAEARRHLDTRPTEQFRYALGEKAPSEVH